MGRADALCGAYVSGTATRPAPYDHLRSVAVIHKSVLHVLTRASRGIDRVTRLRGVRIACGYSGVEGGSTARYVDLLHSPGLTAFAPAESAAPLDQSTDAVGTGAADLRGKEVSRAALVLGMGARGGNAISEPHVNRPERACCLVQARSSIAARPD